MTDLIAQSLALAEGTVTAVGTDGLVTVDAGTEAPLLCRLLETSEAPRLQLAPGDTVLVAALAGGSAFVLGRTALHPAAETPAEVTGRTVEIVMPEGVETVRIAGTRVRIAAEEELTLECGGASVRIDRRGKVVVLGTDVTTRARRLNKVKGARVAIN